MRQPKISARNALGQVAPNSVIGKLMDAGDTSKRKHPLPQADIDAGRSRKVRVGPIKDLADVEFEAVKLFRHIRQNDGRDKVLLQTAGDCIRALKLVADIMGMMQLAAQMAEIKAMLAERNR